MSKSNSDRIWQRFLILYSLLTDCEKGHMPWEKPLPSKVIKSRVGIIDRELNNIYRISKRRWRGRYNQPEPSKERLLAHIAEHDDTNLSDPDSLLSRLVGDVFYYSDRCNNDRARRLLHIWEQYKTVM